LYFIEVLCIFYTIGFTINISESDKQASWAKDVKNQLDQLSKVKEKPVPKPSEHAHIPNKNKKIPQFRYRNTILLAKYRRRQSRP
jgi:hypothetical protein